jgi:hypothetical protein
MACPAETAAAARVLAGMRQILDSSRDQTRSDAMAQAVFARTGRLGFGPLFEGQGMVLLP